MTAAASAFLAKPNVQGPLFMLQLAADLALVLCACTFLHTCLYAIRPGEKGLARYYLYNVIGGAVGGVLTSIVAPLVFSTVAEFPLMVAVAAACAGVWCLPRFRRPISLVSLLLVAATFASIVYRGMGEDLGGRYYIHRARGFFGTVSVMGMKAKSASGLDGIIHEFIHGSTVHGAQIRMPGKWRTATCYYTPEASGYAISGHPKYASG